MTQHFEVFGSHPQPRLIKQVAQLLTQGAVVALPTDACYVLACSVDQPKAVERLRQLRQLTDKHLLTLMCRDLADLAVFAQVDNWQYRFLKEWTPGAYTFVLPATKQVPKKLWHPSRKTIGLRVPDSPVIQALLEHTGVPLLSTSLIPAGLEDPLQTADEILDHFAKRIECVVDAGSLGTVPTTVIDLTGSQPQVQRLGLGTLGGQL
jgi:tRNA threonylcarbamoyl adenosine modification protein (Sua5/YciO/YrdC/YwlC family)